MITSLKARILEVHGPGSQRFVADACAINRGKLSQYASGTVGIPAHHLLRLSVHLGCSPRDLVGWRDVERLEEPA